MASAFDPTLAVVPRTSSNVLTRLVKSSRGFADVVGCFQVFAFPPEKCEVCWVCAQESAEQQPSIRTEELRPAGPLRVGVETLSKNSSTHVQA